MDAGAQPLIIDGRSANRPGKTFGYFEMVVSADSGKTNVLLYTSWMPLIDTAHSVKFDSPTTREVVVTTPNIPGLEVRIPKGAILRDRSGRVINELSLTPIPVDRPPFPLPTRYVPVYFTLHAGCEVPPPQPGQPTGPSPKSGSGGQPGCGSKAGDPVDCATGLFVLDRTDLSVGGTVPLALTRVYRQSDSASRAFGIGTSNRYDIFTIGDMWPYTYQDLILPDGGRIHFARTSSGTGYTDAVYTHTATPSAYYGATIRWVTNEWQLKMRDGRVLHFGECAGCSSSRMAALKGFEDRLGNKLTLTRDTYGNLTQVSNPEGRFINLSYDSANRVTQAQDDIGRTVTYQYDAGGRLAQMTNPDGGVESYTYDASSNMLTVTKPGGQVMVTNQYDGQNRVTRQTLADGGVYQFAYTVDGNGRVTQTAITDPNGHVRQVAFNASGYSTSATWAVGKPEAQSFTYSRAAGSNLLLSSTDALGRTTSYTYDAMGNVTSVTALAGTPQAVTTSFTYESSYSRLATQTDGLGHTTTHRYDSAGNRIETEDALGNATHYSYNYAGQIILRCCPRRSASMPR